MRGSSPRRTPSHSARLPFCFRLDASQPRPSRSGAETRPEGLASPRPLFAKCRRSGLPKADWRARVIGTEPDVSHHLLHDFCNRADEQFSAAVPTAIPNHFACAGPAFVFSAPLSGKFSHVYARPPEIITMMTIIANTDATPL